MAVQWEQNQVLYIVCIYTQQVAVHSLLLPLEWGYVVSRISAQSGIRTTAVQRRITEYRKEHPFQHIYSFSVLMRLPAKSVRNEKFKWGHATFPLGSHWLRSCLGSFFIGNENNFKCRLSRAHAVIDNFSQDTLDSRKRVFSMTKLMYSPENAKTKHKGGGGALRSSRSKWCSGYTQHWV